MFTHVDHIGGFSVLDSVFIPPVSGEIVIVELSLLHNTPIICTPPTVYWPPTNPRSTQLWKMSCCIHTARANGWLQSQRKFKQKTSVVTSTLLSDTIQRVHVVTLQVWKWLDFSKPSKTNKGQHSLLPVKRCGNLIGRITASFRASFAPSSPATSFHRTLGFSITMAPAHVVINKHDLDKSIVCSSAAKVIPQYNSRPQRTSI